MQQTQQAQAQAQGSSGSPMLLGGSPMLLGGSPMMNGANGGVHDLAAAAGVLPATGDTSATAEYAAAGGMPVTMSNMGFALVQQGQEGVDLTAPPQGSTQANMVAWGVSHGSIAVRLLRMHVCTCAAVWHRQPCVFRDGPGTTGSAMIAS